MILYLSILLLYYCFNKIYITNILGQVPAVPKLKEPFERILHFITPGALKEYPQPIIPGTLGMTIPTIEIIMF